MWEIPSGDGRVKTWSHARWDQSAQVCFRRLLLSEFGAKLRRQKDSGTGHEDSEDEFAGDSGDLLLGISRPRQARSREAPLGAAATGTWPPARTSTAYNSQTNRSESALPLVQSRCMPPASRLHGPLVHEDRSCTGAGGGSRCR